MWKEPNDESSTNDSLDESPVSIKSEIRSEKSEDPLPRRAGVGLTVPFAGGRRAHFPGACTVAALRFVSPPV